ncbi:E3 ubiquitin/ISG15 ligase TRIM25-like [Boleophthalmus pectinirostris]|uniref:E3 ubiquitin/ISG15 ligase TRIM25-like n=1 Tax=Boleophthalmus pectinirostris TaxID=150288 RepID=UPI00242A4B01|nr:E3 ubiquitin/ISG15 ligase TRIM25-like [Boleophthalmus pectinirostris]
MAAKDLGIDQELFSCSICLDLLKIPVTIPCGHSYCMICINTHWNEEVGKQSYSCPQCRQSFSQRPVLVKNTMLALLMEGLKKSGPPAAPVSHCSAAHGDVSCDLCSGSKVKAVKSCLQCLVSYCKEHLQPHYDVAALKKHKLVEPTENLQDNMCSQHDEVMKMFCRTDQRCICYLCSVEGHKGHDTVMAAAERTEKQRELDNIREKIIHRIVNTEKNVTSLERDGKTIQNCANAAVDSSDQGLSELIGLLEKRISEMKKQIRSQQEAEEHKVKELQDKLQQEITELKKIHSELDSLSHTEDHLQFLRKFTSISKVSKSSKSSYTSRSTPPFQDMVSAALSDLKNKLSESCQLKPPTVAHNQKVNPPKRDNRPAAVQGSVPSQQNTAVNRPTSIPQPLQPNTSFVPDFYAMTKYPWDPQSLNDNLLLSDNNFCVRRMAYKQNHRHHPARFTDVPQAVSKETLDDCSFWEVSLRRDNVITFGVAYKDIRRNGSDSDSDNCSFGKNNQSWALECFQRGQRCVFWHNGKGVEIQKGVFNLCVFVDPRAGILSFYRRSFCDSSAGDHIYTLRTTFTQPLVAGVRLDDVNSSAELRWCYKNEN